MKIVLWIGNEANQKALANKIQALYPISGIILESRKTKTKITLAKLIEKVIEKLFLKAIADAWWGMKRYYNDIYPDYPQTKTLEVENINSQAAFDFTTEIAPDLIIVSGTRLLKEKMLSIKPDIGILNLHTGLSPYVKGGPNCTNWCIATKQYHLIGNTIMWIDLGIDTGNIITTEFTGFDGNETLLDVHQKVMDHAHQLYVKAIDFLLKGKHSNVKQKDIAKGTTYYTRQWGLKEKIKLVWNMKDFRNSIKSGETEKLKKDIVIVPI